MNRERVSVPSNENSLPPWLKQIRTSAQAFSEAAHTTYNDFMFDEKGISIMERVAAAETRRLFHEAIPHLKDILPELMLLSANNLTGQDQSRYYIPQADEIYIAPKAQRYTDGATIRIFDPEDREFIGINRVRVIQESKGPTNLRHIIKLSHENPDEEPYSSSSNRGITYLTEKDIDDILAKTRYHAFGLPQQEILEQLNKNIRQAGRIRNNNINKVVNGNVDSLRGSVLEFCQATARVLDLKVPKILKLPRRYTMDVPEDRFLNIENGTIWAVPIIVIERKVFFRTVRNEIQDQNEKYEMLDREWCALSTAIYHQVERILHQNVDEETLARVFLGIPLMPDLTKLESLNERIPFYNIEPPEK